MAAQVLKGDKKASEIKYETVTKSSLYVNEKAAEGLKITIPDTMKERAVESFTKISGK
jgi:putative ABC transport system substrate-binding protein